MMGDSKISNRTGFSAGFHEADVGVKHLCVTILHIRSHVDLLLHTMQTIASQKYLPDKLSIQVISDNETVTLPGTKVTIVSHTDNLPAALYQALDSSNAEIFVLLKSGDSFFDYAFNSVNTIFSKFSNIEWLTGIETIQAHMGYNVVHGNTSLRRWNMHIFNRSMYQKSERYIPAASTFWTQSLWHKVRTQINFVFYEQIQNDIWTAFIQTAVPYACDVYLSATHNRVEGDLSNHEKNALTEKSLMLKAAEFLYINNIPYLRTYYRKINKLAHVVRFDHKTQAYFLSEY